jgi:excisionase family DNA binding protein
MDKFPRWVFDLFGMEVVQVNRAGKRVAGAKVYTVKDVQEAHDLTQRLNGEDTEQGAVMDQVLEQVYKLPEVAKALQLTQKTVYGLLLSGQLRGVKISNRWRVRAGDLQAFLTYRTVKRPHKQ